MENPTAFDLNPAIQHWRKNLAQSPALRRENLDELELHLRDSIAALQVRGLSATEAFSVATMRIGKGNALDAEFGKVNGQAVWLDRILWMLIGVQLWPFVTGFFGSLLNGLSGVGVIGGKYDFNTHGVTPIVTLLVLVRLTALSVSIALCWWLTVRKGSNFSAWFQRHLTSSTQLVLTCCLISILVLVAGSLGYLFQFLTFKFGNPAQVGQLSYCVSISSVLVSVIQFPALITLTLILARKRLRLLEE